MAIFKKSDPQPQKPRDRVSPPARGASAEGGISIIGHGMSVLGDITTEGIVRIEGEVRGTIRAGKAIILGQGGIVDGNIFTEDAVIGGTVSGSIAANNRLELQSTCTVDGEIRTRAEHLKLEEGARFTGQVQMIVDAASTAPKIPAGLSPQVMVVSRGDEAPRPLGAPSGPAAVPAANRESTIHLSSGEAGREAGAGESDDGMGEKRKKGATTDTTK